MGNGNIDVGNQSPPRKPGDAVSLVRADSPAGRRIDGKNPLKTERPRICGAMSQQRGDIGRGNESVPQKFVQLVGCRDPNARPEPWVRPRPAPVKS